MVRLRVCLLLGFLLTASLVGSVAAQSFEGRLILDLDLDIDSLALDSTRAA